MAKESPQDSVADWAFGVVQEHSIPAGEPRGAPGRPKPLGAEAKEVRVVSEGTVAGVDHQEQDDPLDLGLLDSLEGAEAAGPRSLSVSDPGLQVIGAPPTGFPENWKGRAFPTLEDVILFQMDNLNAKKSDNYTLTSEVIITVRADHSYD